ncbi:carbohydrate ABC transporter permease [Fimbriimonas ginsengisoli]|uniref:N-Acetyl-D-glucosamine ABC transport system, permease protein 2 n=1 Tax=Fimbriimonas ginsengisoli Gsoil 348 TaxID=661478 RepID=A0A068NSG9_FIMGI|nr:carbohydrate ABC transporter permease [Fimbriimonas ginsengisoli]AIE85710.1 N-Acetyl-D-glucosamine ABC transport system, permease protein 2 [Fimbriimonas ginsengisoli Gsoil 348]
MSTVPVELLSPEAERYRTATNRAEKANAAARALLWLLLLVGSIIFLIPLYLMLAMSLKSSSELAHTSSWAWPQQITFENFQKVLTNPNAPFFLFFKNTLVIASLGTLGVLFSSSLVAYPFARLRFRGRDRLFILLLSTMMLPGVVTMIPTYVLFTHLYWVDTIKPLVVPAFFGGGAFNIFLIRQFFMGIPRELDEAALIDGASHATIFWQVIMPNSGAVLATVGIFSFIFNWKDFMGPLLYLNSPDRQTLELGLRTYQSLQAEQWHLLMAGSVIVVIPLLVIFLLGQKWIIRGIAMTGGK